MSRVSQPLTTYEELPVHMLSTVVQSNVIGCSAVEMLLCRSTKRVSQFYKSFMRWLVITLIDSYLQRMMTFSAFAEKSSHLVKIYAVTYNRNVD